MLSEVSGELHFDCTTTGDDSVSLDGSEHDHDGIVERSSGLLNVLGSTATDDESHSLGVAALGEHVIALASELDLLELTASSKDLFGDSVGGSLDLTTSGLDSSLEVVRWNTTSAENVSVSKELSGQVTDWELREDNLGAGISDLLELVVDNLPFGVDNLLVVLWVFKSDFSTVSLGLQLELDVQSQNLGVLEGLWLLLETGVGESLAEANTVDEEGVGDRATGDPLDSDVLLVEVVIQVLDGVDDHLGEEVFILADDLGVHGGLGALQEQVALLFFSLVANLDGDLLDSLSAEFQGFTVTLDDDLRVHAFFDKVLRLLEQLTGGEDDTCRAITNLVILTSSDVDEGLGSWVHDVEQTDQGGAIIGDGDTATVMDEFVHATWSCTTQTFTLRVRQIQSAFNIAASPI